MTGLLKDALTERAATEDVPQFDLDGIVRTGDRRIRRRRGLFAGAAAAALLAVVAGGLAVVDRGGDPPVSGTAGQFAERKVTWSSGNTIHYGDRKIPVAPVTVYAFVQTDSGFVLVDRNGDVFVADGRQVAKIAAGNLGRRLTADDTGSLVGWVDFTPRVPEYVVYDVATRREVLRTAEGNSATAVGTGPGMRPGSWTGAPAVVGVDGGTAYFAAGGGVLEDGDGLYRWDIATGRSELIKRGQSPDLVSDIGAGRFVIKSDRRLVISADPSAGGPQVSGEYGDLSPGGAALFVMADGGSAFHETAGLRPMPVRHPGYARLAWSYWLDDDRLVTLGIHELDGEPIGKAPDLVTCSIRAAECVTSVPDVDQPDTPDSSPAFQLPIGWNLGDR